MSGSMRGKFKQGSSDNLDDGIRIPEMEIVTPGRWTTTLHSAPSSSSSSSSSSSGSSGFDDELSSNEGGPTSPTTPPEDPPTGRLTECFLGEESPCRDRGAAHRAASFGVKRQLKSKKRENRNEVKTGESVGSGGEILGGLSSQPNSLRHPNVGHFVPIFSIVYPDLSAFASKRVENTNLSPAHPQTSAPELAYAKQLASLGRKVAPGKSGAYINSQQRRSQRQETVAGPSSPPIGVLPSKIDSQPTSSQTSGLSYPEQAEQNHREATPEICGAFKDSQRACPTSEETAPDPLPLPLTTIRPFDIASKPPSPHQPLSPVASISPQHPTFVPYSLTTKNVCEIDKDIVDKLKAKRNSSNSGFIYIYKSSYNLSHIKIGRTKRSLAKRKQEWDKCRIPTYIVEDKNQKQFSCHSIVESLLRIEFFDKRRKFKCEVIHKTNGEKTEHDEWFELREDIALKSLERWRKWITSEDPFDKNGNLNEHWAWRVSVLEKNLGSVNWDNWTCPGMWGSLQWRVEVFKREHHGPIVKHLGRKDLHFLLVSIILLLMTHIWLGASGVVIGFLALLAL